MGGYRRTQGYVCLASGPLLYCTVQTSNLCTSRPDVCQYLVAQTPMDIKSKRPSSLMINISCKLKLHSVVRSPIRPCQGNLWVIGHAVVYYTREVGFNTCTLFQLFCIKVRPCNLTSTNRIPVSKMF